MRLAHDVTGDGPPTVLLHAFPLSRRMWSRECLQWGRFVRVITPDLPGFGESPRQGTPSIPAMASAVFALLDQLDIHEPVIAAGLSMGGYVVFEMVRQAPERVRALGLFATRATGDTAEQRQGRLMLAERIREEGMQPLVETMGSMLLGRTAQASRPDLSKIIMTDIQANDPEGVADALVAMARRADHTDLLPSLARPTLIVAGEEDAVIPMAQTADMHRRIPGARLEVLPHAGHLVHLEQPALLDGVVERFVRNLP